MIIQNLNTADQQLTTGLSHILSYLTGTSCVCPEAQSLLGQAGHGIWLHNKFTQGTEIIQWLTSKALMMSGLCPKGQWLGSFNWLQQCYT